MTSQAPSAPDTTSTAALPSLQRGRDVLILTPRDWFMEECCVLPNPTATPSAALMLAALLRQHGHRPRVVAYRAGEGLNLTAKPQAVVFYAPFHLFVPMVQPIVRALRPAFDQASFILVMYDSLDGSEEQALICCPELDYAALPHEKELAVLDVVEHGGRRCPGGFSQDSGLLHRDQDDRIQGGGPRRALADLDHLPYLGQELAIFWREYSHQPYDSMAVTFQRGCPNPCTFCPMRGTRPRYRDPQLVVREMEAANQLTGRPYLLSLEVLQEPQRMHELCDLLLAQGLQLTDGLGARCEYVSDQDLLDKLARAGLSHLYFGVEAANEPMRARLRKPISDADLTRAVQMAGRAGLKFTCSFITGLPWEDGEYYRDFARLVVELGSHPHCRRLNLARLQPWPGLPISREMVEMNLLPLEPTFQEWNQPYAQLMPRIRHTRHLGQADLEGLYQLLNQLAEQVLAARPGAPAPRAACA